MAYVYAVLGAGRQGTAAAYDFARWGEAAEIRLLDASAEVAARAAERINALAGRPVARGLAIEAIEATDPDALARALRGAQVTLSALPYRLNLSATRAAIAAGSHLCDLGGKTDIVWQQLELDAAAREAGVAVVPDCGLAPGMANTLAVLALSELRAPQGVRIYAGGLPARPVGPLDYKLVFSIEGLVNEYSGQAAVLRDGRVAFVPALTELEELEFPALGRCEAFITSGGTSTCPWTFEGSLQVWEEKTVRYPGHCQRIRLLFDLGLLDETPLEGLGVSPREIFHRAAAPRLTFPDVPDMVVLRVVAWGADGARMTIELEDHADPETGFSAMERTTGFGAAIVGMMMARGEVAPGAVPLERSVPPHPYLAELERRGFEVRMRASGR